jgi:hypothetical protein
VLLFEMITRYLLRLSRFAKMLNIDRRVWLFLVIIRLLFSVAVSLVFVFL